MEEFIDIVRDAESENTENSEDEYDPEDFSIEETPDICDDILCPDLEAVDDSDEEDDTPLSSRLEENLIDIIVEQSNVYCTQKKLEFEPITNDEIKSFWG